MVFIMQKFSVLDMTADDKVDPNVVLNGHDKLSRDNNFLTFCRLEGAIEQADDFELANIRAS